MYILPYTAYVYVYPEWMEWSAHSVNIQLIPEAAKFSWKWLCQRAILCCFVILLCCVALPVFNWSGVCHVHPLPPLSRDLWVVHFQMRQRDGQQTESESKYMACTYTFLTVFVYPRYTGRVCMYMYMQYYLCRQISKKHQIRLDTPWLDPSRTLAEQV